MKDDKPIAYYGVSASSFIVAAISRAKEGALSLRVCVVGSNIGGDFIIYQTH
jgi:hypothetical protein